MRRGLLLLGTALALCPGFVVGPAFAGGETLRLAITDLEGLEQLQREFGAFRDLLAARTGYEIEFFAVPNRTAAVEALRSARIDFVLTGPAEYVVFRQRTNAEPVVAFSRPDYFADVIVLADSGLDAVADLRGKKVALGDIGSTSKHLAPLQLLKDGGLDPRRDVATVHTSVKLGWEALKRGDVAAFCTTNDKYLKLRSEERELPPGAFKVIARGRDLPNDVLLARPGVDPAVVAKLRKGILDHSADLVAAILKGEDNQKFQGMKFLLGVKDSDYDYVREMYRTAGYAQFSGFPGE
jgi:phosphonate transport system substrate-binding protein